MGYSQAQLDDLAATIAAVDCDTIVIATPVDLARLIPLDKPYCRVHYDLEEISHPDLTDVVCDFLRAHTGSTAITVPVNKWLATAPIRSDKLPGRLLAA